MDVIPVVDLMGGVVVRARFGDRRSYAPLAPTSAPHHVVAGFLALFPFRRIYVADLDAIESRGDHAAEAHALAVAFPQVEFWVDAGVEDSGEARAFLHRHERAALVVGSESLKDASALAALKSEERLVLSLDFRGEDFLGDPEILAQPRLWPQRVIAMTLARVGADAGPDIARLSSIAAATQAAVYGAGGVRGPADIEALARAGAAGALVASALHDGRLARADLERLAPQK